jgi:hypothetical protein
MVVRVVSKAPTYKPRLFKKSNGGSKDDTVEGEEKD